MLPASTRPYQNSATTLAPAAADWGGIPAEICQEILSVNSHSYSRGGEVCKAWHEVQKRDTCLVKEMSLGPPIDPMLPGPWPHDYSPGTSRQRRVSEAAQLQGWLQQHASEGLQKLKL